MQIRRLSLADLPACLALARERGFSGGELAWRLGLAAGEGWGAQAPEGGLAGAALLLRFGRLASLSLAVSRRFERRGVGRALAARALASSTGATVQMNAPGSAVPFSGALGFSPVGATVRWAGPAPASAAGVAGISLRPIGGADLAGIVAQDEIAFGAQRRALLEALLPASARVALAVAGGRPIGYGVAWEDGEAVSIGPVVAEDGRAGIALLSHLAAGHALPVRVDVPADREAAHAWASAAGLQRLGTAALLSRGGQPLPGKRERLFALVTAALV